MILGSKAVRQRTGFCGQAVGVNSLKILHRQHLRKCPETNAMSWVHTVLVCDFFKYLIYLGLFTEKKDWMRNYWRKQVTAAGVNIYV